VTVTVGDNETISIDEVTPSVDIVSDIFATSVGEELPDQDYLTYAVTQSWTELLNTSQAAPFVLCTAGGREAVEGLQTSALTRDGSLPLYSRSDLNCFAAMTDAWAVVNRTATSEDSLVYATPMLPILKVSDILFGDVTSGRLARDPGLPRIALRTVLLPGVGERTTALAETVLKLQGGLESGEYKEVLRSLFLWTAQENTLPEEAMHYKKHGMTVRLPRLKLLTTFRNQRGEWHICAEKFDRALHSA
jgi:hypothetical protein